MTNTLHSGDLSLEQGAKNIKVGIIGDGQLALMLAESLQKRGIRFMCLKQSVNSSMERTYPAECTVDKEHFRKSCDVFTLENEFLKVEELTTLLQDKADRLFPALPSYAHFADKVSQRKLYQELAIRSPQWMELSHPDQIARALQDFSFPFIAKASAGGYDGKGVRVVRNQEDFDKVLQDFGLFEGKVLLLEEMVKIKKEVAQGFLRHANGKSSFLPLVETVQEEGVCNLVFYPPEVSSRVKEQIEGMLQKLINFPLVGIFNFEFFVDDQELVYINEGAPRPHNSQHLTIDASDYSQFDLLALYCVDSPDIPQKLETAPSVMINVLGQSSGTQYELKLPKVEGSVEIVPKLYAKEKCSPGRKMGHINIVDKMGNNDLKGLAERIYREYRI